MKKIIGVTAILLSVILVMLYRQITHRPNKVPYTKISVPSIMQENLILGSMLLQ